MSEKFDRELELVKLQIVAGHCFTKVQIDAPLASSAVIVFVIFVFSLMVQYPSNFTKAALFVVIGLVLVFLFIRLDGRASREYEKGITQLNAYVEDFRAGRCLPSITKMCSLKEKKDKSK
jgi:hypothetical protein